MHARVATFEGADVETQKAVIENIRAQSDSGPPEGVPATEFLFLSDGAGKAYAIMLFENEADCQKGHETLSAMEPPIPGGMGRRTSVELLEVPLYMKV
jgi:hypothetical protein